MLFALLFKLVKIIYLRIQFENLTMQQTYHKRLGNYLSQPKGGLRRASSEQSFLAAAKAKYIGNQLPTSVNSQRMYGTSKIITVPCQQCQLLQNRSTSCHHQKINKYTGIQNEGNGNYRALNQYFGPQIKTITNTLLDIRQQMRSKNSQGYTGKNQFKMGKTGEQTQTYEQVNEKLGRAHQRQLKYKLDSRSQKIQELQFKIDELEQIIERLQRKNKQKEDDIVHFQNRITNYERQMAELRNRLMGVESERNQALERERSLQIKVMDIRANLMHKQQILRQLNFNEEQQRHLEMSKKLSMRPSGQISMTVNSNQYKESRSSQTQLTQVDIENGYKQLNQTQDQLCERINGNLKIQKKIFARLEDVDYKLREAYDRIYHVQEEAMRMGINVNAGDF